LGIYSTVLKTRQARFTITRENAPHGAALAMLMREREFPCSIA